jgi:hypothetical protein
MRVLIFCLLITTLWAIQGDIILSDTVLPQLQLSWDVDVGKMKDSQLYDMIARYYGAPRTPSYDQLRMDIDLFSRPEGFLLFSIGGLSSNLMPQSDLKMLSKNLIDLIPSDPSVSSSYSLLASILTGTSSHFHGVVTHSQYAKDVYRVGNFYDAMHRLYEEKEIVSASSSLDGALVLSPHLKNFGQTTKAHHWDSKTKTFVSVSGASKYGIGIKDFSLLLGSLASAMGTEINYQESERTVSIARPGVSALTFDLSSSSVEALFAEVLFVLNMADTPVQFLSFHFDSLTGISTHYGTASEEYVLAVRMIDAVISKVYHNYQTHHTLKMSIIYYPNAFQTKEVVDTIQPILADDIKTTVGKDLFTTISDNLPNIYLSDEGKAHIDDLCNSLRNSLDQFAVNVDCSAALKRYLLQNPEPAPEPTPGPSPSPTPAPPPPPGQASRQEVELVHIVLWLVIAMIAALLQACYHLSVLDGSNEPEFKPKTYEGGLRSKTTKM